MLQWQPADENSVERRNGKKKFDIADISGNFLKLERV